MDNWATFIDGRINAANIVPVHVLINLGVNDITSNLPDQTTWQNNYIHILDEMHVAWPSAMIHITKPYKAGYDTSCDVLAGWIDNIIAARPAISVLLDDERAWYKPNIATYSDDGVHYNAAGQTAAAAAKKTAMGF